MMVSLEDLKRRQSEFKAEVSAYIKEGKSIRSIRHEDYLKRIVKELEVLIALTISSTAKTHVANLRNFYSTLAGRMHVGNNRAADSNKVFYVGIGERTDFSNTA